MAPTLLQTAGVACGAGRPVPRRKIEMFQSLGFLFIWEVLSFKHQSVKPNLPFEHFGLICCIFCLGQFCWLLRSTDQFFGKFEAAVSFACWYFWVCTLYIVPLLFFLCDIALT